VKAANPGFSICEIGATIGRMWRELSDDEKQRHMEDFTKDKVLYRRRRIQFINIFIALTGNISGRHRSDILRHVLLPSAILSAV